MKGHDKMMSFGGFSHFILPMMTTRTIVFRKLLDFTLLPEMVHLKKNSNKPRVFLALFHRNKHSLPKPLGQRSFHWAIVIAPKDDVDRSQTIDVTNAMQIDPVSHVNLNPDGEWLFRCRDGNPMASFPLVLLASIGRFDAASQLEGNIMEAIEIECRVPRKEEEIENCQWWVKNVVQYLLSKGCLMHFDIDKAFSQCQRVAEDRIDSSNYMEFRLDVLSVGGKACDVSFGRSSTMLRSWLPLLC